MNKWFIISGTLLLIILAVFFYFKGNNEEHVSNQNTSYYIIHSDLFKESGGMTGIDIDGNITSYQKLKIQDVSKFSMEDEEFIASGSRANNNLVINQQGDVKEFYLLDNPNYSGVTSITSHEEKIIAVMNGNIEDNTKLHDIPDRFGILTKLRNIPRYKK